MSAVIDTEVLLTDLCAICHIQPLKYTCPRCGIHTCSLPCVKKHKLRAQCSGIRDPAAYKKRSDLSTASSIDRDYNFIAKVERSLQRADDNVNERGITLAPAQAPRYHSGREFKSKTETEIEACGVSVIRSPKVFSRSRQSATHWDTRHKCLMWTVEWILHDGKKVIANTRGSNSVAHAFTNAVGKKGFLRKRKFDEHKDREKTGAKPDEAETTAPSKDKQTEESSCGEAPQKVTGLTEVARSYVLDIKFYLHRPKTTSNLKCLIPIEAELSISEVLHQRTIIEFPTLYAIFERPEDLTPPFITEAAYLKEHGEEPAISHQLETQANANLI